MNLAFGVLFLWMGSGALYVASHGVGATSPWAAFKVLIDKMRESEGGEGDGSQT